MRGVHRSIDTTGMRHILKISSCLHQQMRHRVMAPTNGHSIAVLIAGPVPCLVCDEERLLVSEFFDYLVSLAVQFGFVLEDVDLVGVVAAATESIVNC